MHDRSSEPLSPETGPILAVGDVERMLDDTPRDRLARERGAHLLTDSYDFSELERREARRTADRCRWTPPRPIPLDLSDWGDATPQPAIARRASIRRDADDAADASDAAASTDAQARRNAASS